MRAQTERRAVKRMRYFWPLWFGYDHTGKLNQAKVIDLSEDGVCFSFSGNEDTPEVGHHLLTRFSYPVMENDEFSMGSYYHWSEVVRVDRHEDNHCRIALKLRTPLADELPVDEVLPIMA